MPDNTSTQDVFVSHRCKGYHEGLFLNVPLERLLKEHGLSHCYGCNYSKGNEIGFIENNVKRAAQRASCYMAVIQSTWQIRRPGLDSLMGSVDAKWPPIEFKWWRELHPTSEKCFGLLINNAQIPNFLDGVFQCYPVFTTQNIEHLIPIVLTELGLGLYADITHARFVNNALELFKAPGKTNRSKKITPRKAIIRAFRPFPSKK